MKEVLKTIISNLVDNEEAVEINQIDSEKSITFEVKVAEADMGKVIGKQGRLAKAVAAREHKKVSVEFIG